MSRPFLQLGIMELEKLFSQSSSDVEVLRSLEFELQNRQVPRAKDLLAKVRKTIEAKAVTKADATAPSDSPPTHVVRVGGDLFEAEHRRGQEPKPKEPVKVKSPVWAAGEIPVISLSDAYRALKATPGSSWESIELTRRQLVQRASPVGAIDEKRQQLQRDAERINAAYRIVAQDRLGLH